MSEYRLPPDENIDVSKILEDLEHYRPRRRGWTWREPAPDLTMGPFTYHDCSRPLKDGVPHTLRDTAKHFGITRERVRQIESAAMKKMREYMIQQEKEALAKRK